jgi:hypothetical protein
VRAGHSLTLLASGLRRARDVGVALVREGYSAEAGLKARRGTATGSIFIPKALGHGSYWLGVLDFSQLNRGTGPVRIASARISVRP